MRWPSRSSETVTMRTPGLVLFLSIFIEVRVPIGFFYPSCYNSRALRACHRLAGGVWRTRIQRTPRAPVSLREEPPGSGGLNAHPASDHSETVRVADYLSSSNDGSSPRLHTGHTFTGLARS